LKREENDDDSLGNGIAKKTKRSKEKPSKMTNHHYVTYASFYSAKSQGSTFVNACFVSSLCNMRK
jgi:hypothetical protein